MGSNPLDVIKGYRTYLAVVGLIGLGVYQVSIGEYEQAMQSFMAALAAFGLRDAIDRKLGS